MITFERRVTIDKTRFQIRQKALIKHVNLLTVQYVTRHVRFL